MKGLKFLFASWKKMPVFFWLGLGMSAVFLVLPFVMHETLGSEDYLYPKIFLFFPSFFMAEIGLICGCRDIAANKLVRSFPIARELYTKAVPTFILILTLGISIVVMLAYFVFLGIIGAEERQFADTLIIATLIIVPELIAPPFFTTTPGGGAIMIYFVMAPIVVVSMIGAHTTMHMGFDLPLWAAALIFTVSAAVSVMLLYRIAAWRYIKSNIKINNPIINYETK